MNQNDMILDMTLVKQFVIIVKLLVIIQINVPKNSIRNVSKLLIKHFLINLLNLILNLFLIMIMNKLIALITLTIILTNDASSLPSLLVLTSKDKLFLVIFDKLPMEEQKDYLRKYMETQKEQKIILQPSPKASLCHQINVKW